MLTILRKELADHFNSTRYVILFSLILCVALLVTNAVSLDIRAQIDQRARLPHVFLLLFTSGKILSLLRFIALFGPIIGIILGFDAINRERNEGTLSTLLSQPVHRDAILVGKFLAGMAVITSVVTGVVLLISGLGMVVVGVVPTGEQAARVALYAVLSILYIGTWLGLAMLFSVLFRSVGTSLLAAIVFWIVFSFFVTLGANLIANVISPVENSRDLKQVVRNRTVADTASLFSPVNLYSEAAATLLNPDRRTTKDAVLGFMEGISITRFNNPLDIPQSAMVVAPYLIAIVALSSVCFAASYTVFLRQEIRSM